MKVSEIIIRKIDDPTNETVLLRWVQVDRMYPFQHAVAVPAGHELVIRAAKDVDVLIEKVIVATRDDLGLYPNDIRLADLAFPGSGQRS